MAYKTYGFFIEGINIDNFARTPSLFGASLIANPNQYIDIELNSHKWVGEVAVGFPSLSASKIDPLTGKITGGSCKLSITANDAMSRIFMNQALARKNVAVLAAPLLISDTQVTLTATTGFTVPSFLYLGEEVIRIDSFDSGTTFNISRGQGLTQTLYHEEGSYLYNKPQFWIGREISLVEIFLPDRLTASPTPTLTRIVWRGFIDAQPQANNSTSRIELSASSLLDVIRKIEVNKFPLQNNSGVRDIKPTFVNGVNALYGDVYETGTVTRTRKVGAWATDGSYRAIQVGESMTMLKGTRLGDPHVLGEPAILGVALLDSPPFLTTEVYNPPFWELLVWSKELDAICGSRNAGDALSPTSNCQYPYHPLTVAAALLFSTNETTERPSVYDVLDENWSAQIAGLANLSAWDSMIAQTSWMEIDELILGWDGQKFDIWPFITEQLLPAFGLQLTQDELGRLIPVKIGIGNLVDYNLSPIIQPLPEAWDWIPSISSALDVIYAKIGERPWGLGQDIVVSGEGVRTTSSKTTRFIDPVDTSVDWPFFKSGSAQSIGLTFLQQRLAFRYDGLPFVKFKIDGAIFTPFLGQFVRLEKPDGLKTNILFDVDGERVDTWTSIPFLAQITSIRPVVDKGIYEVEALLTNYSFGKYAKWRAPAARIKERTGTGTYLIEGTASDFGTDQSDGEFFTSGDEVHLYTNTLNIKATGSINVVSVSLSGSDYLITLSGDWTPNGIATDWIQLSGSDQYSNTAVIGASEPYPYTFMTDNAQLDRPGGESDPDEYA